jgi:RecA/RadA recombinase
MGGGESMTTKEEKIEILRLSDVPLQEVKWLWYPYIPFGKITIIQGDPGEGKTTLALRLAAACTTGQALPGMEVAEPFNVIYQTAENGLGDTVKPRLMDAGANQERVLNINESEKTLTLLMNALKQPSSRPEQSF